MKDNPHGFESFKDSVVISRMARTLMIYNYKTKQVRDFVIPKEVYPDSFTRWSIVSVKEIQNLECGRKGILQQNFYIIYDPSKDDWISVNETEARGLPNLWIRSLYPNPATAPSKITANIMCYLSTVSDVEIGLYDFMGQIGFGFEQPL